MLLSICIPTKNRYSTLLPVIETILAYVVGQDYEIVISDNSDDNSEFLLYQRENEDSRIKYIYTKKNLTVSENADQSLRIAKGDYITFIGDDDLVHPNILEIVRLAKSKDIKALNFTPANYYWPTVKFNRNVRFNFPASLQIPKKINKLNFVGLNSVRELKRVLDIGCVSMLDLPKVYHGLVRKDVINDIKKKFGNIVCGSSPDMALAVAASKVISNYFYVNYPVTVTGVSMVSAAGMGAAMKHNDALENVPWLRNDILDVWNPRIPKFWQGYTIWCQSAYEVLQLIGDEYEQINYKMLYSKSFIMRDHIDKENVKMLLEDKKSSSYVLYFKSFVLKNLRKILDSSPNWVTNLYFVFRGDFKKFKNIKNVETLKMCMVYLKEV